MLAFVLYYRSSAETSSRTHEQAVDCNSQCTPQGHVSAYLVWLTLASRPRNLFLSMLRAWAVLNCLILWVIVNDSGLGYG